MKNKIFFDVTQLIDWKGNLTGIPRTTDEIAIRLKELQNAEFISWNFDIQAFEAVDIHNYYENIAPANRSFFKNKPKTQQEKLSAAVFLKKVIRSSRLLSKATEKVKHTKGRVSKKIQSIRSMPSSRPVVVNPGDMVFIPCGLWDSDDYMDTILSYKKNGAKLAFICYDILPIVVPQFSGQWGKPMKDFTKRVTSICDVVFCISDYTKKDLTHYLKSQSYNVPEMVTIRLGDAFNNSTPSAPKDKRFLDTGLLKSGEDFILCTGTVEARKNHTLLYYTYKLAHSKGIKLPKLIIAGRPGYRTENIIGIIKDDPEVNNSITMLFDVSDEELSWLYSHCKFTVYPSFYEGWGLPIAESIARGVPCISSNTSSMIEVAPGIALYFNPASPEECLTSIQKLMNPKEFKKTQDKTKQYVPVEWDETYDAIIKSVNKYI